MSKLNPGSLEENYKKNYCQRWQRSDHVGCSQNCRGNRWCTYWTF